MAADIEQTSFGAAFAQIDASRQGSALIEYLDWVAALPAVGRAKARSLDLLELAPGDRLLDVGCGMGDDVRLAAARMGTAGLAVGVDTSALVIKEARRRARGCPGVTFHIADASSLPFDDGEFRAVRADRTLQHVTAIERAVTELTRVTAPGGRVVVSEMLNDLLVDGEVDTSVAAKAVGDRFWARGERRGWVGFLLPLLFRRSGLAQVQMIWDREVVGDMETIDGLLRLRDLARQAVSDGILEEAVAASWLSDLWHRGAEGRVVLRMHFLHVLGLRDD